MRGVNSHEEMKDNIKNEEKLDKDLKVKLGDSLASVGPMAGLQPKPFGFDLIKAPLRESRTISMY